MPEDDPVGKSLEYTHDASTVDPAKRPNPAAEQNCANCALAKGVDAGEWIGCNMFANNSVAAKGWCKVWAPKA